MKPQQHQAQRIEFQERIIRSQNWTTSLNCEYWDKKEELCTTFAARPPLTVVVVGCPEWLGEIPF
jgi:hypothetical protein